VVPRHRGCQYVGSLSLTLVRNAGSNVYTFNDRSDSFYANRGGFFPINGELWGNSAGDNKNFHFSFELSTSFIYRHNSAQVFTFTGDDDVWVFVDNKLVIDIGGIHSAVSQTIELDRLAWLQDGQRYNLKFFFAERHRTQSNFRIDTTINLESAQLPTTAALYD
jgi:fibro-slime domain-containing protein